MLRSILFATFSLSLTESSPAGLALLEGSGKDRAMHNILASFCQEFSAQSRTIQTMHQVKRTNKNIWVTFSHNFAITLFMPSSLHDPSAVIQKWGSPSERIPAACKHNKKLLSFHLHLQNNSASRESFTHDIPITARAHDWLSPDH